MKTQKRLIKEAQDNGLSLNVSRGGLGGGVPGLSHGSTMGHEYDLFILTPEPELTEFEIELHEIVSQVLSDKRIPDCREQFEKEAASALLMKAKKEICKGCTVSIDSYIKGRDDERKEAEKSSTSHYPTFEPPCFHGGICINPFKDCINCPRTGGDMGISTISGTCKKD